MVGPERRVLRIGGGNYILVTRADSGSAVTKPVLGLRPNKERQVERSKSAAGIPTDPSSAAMELSFSRHVVFRDTLFT